MDIVVIPEFAALNLWHAVLEDPIAWGRVPEGIEPPGDLVGSMSYVLCAIPDEHAQLLILRYCQNLTYDVIGQRLSLSKERVRQRVNLALQQIRESAFLMDIVQYGVRNRTEPKTAPMLVGVTVPRNILDIELSDLNLCPRAYRSLFCAQLDTVGKILEKGKGVRDLRLIGSAAYCNITTALLEVGVPNEVVRKIFF